MRRRPIGCQGECTIEGLMGRFEVLCFPQGAGERENGLRRLGRERYSLP